VRHLAEDGRVKIRNVRRDVMHDLRELREGGDVGEDEERRAEAELQKVTDGKIGDLEQHLKAKEAEIMEV
jgi:ribosome recycling factor